jgi:hypothetical protein
MSTISPMTTYSAHVVPSFKTDSSSLVSPSSPTVIQSYLSKTSVLISLIYSCILGPEAKYKELDWNSEFGFVIGASGRSRCFGIRFMESILSIHAFVQRKLHVRVRGTRHIFICPIQIGLGGKKERKVVLTTSFIPSPGTASED